MLRKFCIVIAKNKKQTKRNFRYGLVAAGRIVELTTTVNNNVVLAVLINLTMFMNRHLSEDGIVRAVHFGSLQIGISSEGTET